MAGTSSPSPQPYITTPNHAPRPPTSSLPLPFSAWPATAPPLTSLSQSKSVGTFTVVSKEIFASPESPKKSTFTKCQLTPAEKQRIEVNRNESIRRRNDLFKQERSELSYKAKSSRTTVNTTPKNQLHTFSKDEKWYNAYYFCRRFFLCSQAPTPTSTIDCKCKKTAVALAECIFGYWLSSVGKVCSRILLFNKLLFVQIIYVLFQFTTNIN